jgi:di/tricarboxylate transporter
MTGCFQWLALHLTRMSKGNGLALFLLYYTLSSILTIFTSNDVSIMALTVSTPGFTALQHRQPAERLVAAGPTSKLLEACSSAACGMHGCF